MQKPAAIPFRATHQLACSTSLEAEACHLYSCTEEKGKRRRALSDAGYRQNITEPAITELWMIFHCLNCTWGEILKQCKGSVRESSLQSILSYENVNLVQQKEILLFIQKLMTSKAPSLCERTTDALGTGNNESIAL